ncbi:BTAD domain-containing putative transcriptional regulator [Streptomyces sp. NPDC057592]|uniref:AfsR/SARP family transcriptional regulator n=1 Tax=Streptomyces sp. NPDC057592 TaxID=3346175 RepID=UPI0036904DDB
MSCRRRTGPCADGVGMPPERPPTTPARSPERRHVSSTSCHIPQGGRPDSGPVARMEAGWRGVRVGRVTRFLWNARPSAPHARYGGRRMCDFRVLGALEILDGFTWKSAGGPKVRILLAVLLAAAGRTISIDRLVEELWTPGSHPHRDQRNLVQQYVMRLRRQLGDRDRTVLVTKAPGYRLVFDPARLDACRFEALHAEGQGLFAAGAYEKAFTVLGSALELWRGPAMEDVPVSPTVRTEAERLEEARLAAAELRIDASHRVGGHIATLAELRALRDGNPLREGLWEKEMTALVESGRRAEALDVYQRARRVFQDELGLEPGTALRDLQQLILTDGSAGGGRL